MLPAFDVSGNLPPGMHRASWHELCDRFGFTESRRALLAGLHEALLSLKAAGCRTVYLNGSFVSKKSYPNDFDGCWEPSGVRVADLDPVLLRFENRRAAQKAKFGGELFPASVAATGTGASFLEFFQTDKRTGARKGIVVLDLSGFT